MNREIYLYEVKLAQENVLMLLRCFDLNHKQMIKACEPYRDLAKKYSEQESKLMEQDNGICIRSSFVA